MLAKFARDGYAILTPVPSCTLMFKQELPLMYPDDADIVAVRDAMFDPFEYFVLRRKDGLLKTDFKQALGKVSYHIPCHSRVQNMGQKTREMLEAMPGTEVTTVERCAGHDGTWGVKTEYFDNSMKIGRPVFRMMAEPAAGLRQLGLPDRGAPHHAGHGRETQRGREGPSRSRCYASLRHLAFLLLAGCARRCRALPPGETAFGVLGDTPYTEAEVERLDALIDEMNAQPLAFVVHVGDIGSSALACGDDWLLEAQGAVRAHPPPLRPGARRQRVERLQAARSSGCERWRELFCEDAAAEFCEHLRWESGGWVFVTLNVPGHNNNVRHAEHAPRMAAVLAWLDEAARARARAEAAWWSSCRPTRSSPCRATASPRCANSWRALGAPQPGKVVLIHGDTHLYRDDEPLPGPAPHRGVGLAGRQLACAECRWRATLR